MKPLDCLMIKVNSNNFPKFKKNKGVSFVIDSILSFALIVAINAGIFFPINPHWPIPVLLAIPFVRYLVRKDILQNVIFTLTRPWFLGVVGIFCIYRTITGDLSSFAYLLSSALFLLVISIYISVYSNAFDLLTWQIIIVLAGSCIFFLMRIIEIPIVEQIYDSIWGIFRSPVPTGFTGSLFQFGYHLTLLIPLTISLTFNSKKILTKLLAFLFLILGIVSLFESGQRGPALGIGITLIFVILPYLNGRNRIYLVIFSLICSILFLNYNNLNNSYLASKILTLGDYEWRLNLQLRAVEALLTYPQGLFIANVTWGKIASDLFATGELTAHNSYLVVALYLGWLFALIMIHILFFSIRTFVLDLRLNSRKRLYIGNWAHLGLLAGYFALLINALFHNPSLFTLDGTTWIAYCILWLTHDTEKMRNKYERKVQGLLIYP